MYAALRAGAASCRAASLIVGRGLPSMPRSCMLQPSSGAGGLTSAPLVGAAGMLPGGHTGPQSLCLGGAASVRQFHATPSAAAGRHTTSVPERVTHWRKHISKKAEKRYKKRRERVVEAKQAAAQVTALTVPTTLPALPSPSALAEMSTQNRIIIESLLSHDAPAPSSGAAQLSADETAALLTGFQTGAVERSRETLQAALRALSAQGRFTETLELFSSMRRWGLQPDTIEYNHLILACARQRNVGAAFSVYDSMVRGAVPVDGVTFGGLMQACIRTGNLPRAFQQLQIAEAAGLPLTPVLFTHLIVGCVRAGEFDRAWLVFDHMRTKHCEPDSVAFTAMISACAKRDQVERAVNLLTEMKQLSLPITAVTYNAMMHAAGRSFRQAHMAHTYFNEMTVAGHAHDDYSYTAVLTACSHTGDVVRARTYMWQAMKEGIRPSLFTLNALLAVYMRALRKPKASVERSEEARAMALSDAKAGELLQLEDPESAAKLLAGQKRVLGDYARIVEGDPNQLVENLLADYYQEDNTGDKPMKRDKGRDAEDVDASAPGSLITAAKEGVDDDPFVPADPSSLLPQVSEYNQDLTHPDYLEAKESLIRDIGISPALFDKLEADNEVPFAIDTDEEMLRAEVEAREDRKLRVREAADAMELLQLEADVAAQKAALQAEAREAAGVLGSGLVDVDVLADDGDHPMLGGRGKKAAAAGGGSGAAKGGAGRSGRSAGGVVFDDIMQEAKTTAGRRRGPRARAGAGGGGDGAAAAGAGGDAAVAEGTTEADGSRTLPDGSRIIGSIHLPPPGPDGRVRFKDYLKALEASLEKDIFGSPVMSGGSSDGSDNDAAQRRPREIAAGTGSAAPRLLTAGGAADAASAGAGGSELVVADGGAAAAAPARKPRRQVSLFDSDSDVEVGGVPLKKLLDVRDIPIPQTSDSDGDHDPIKLYDYFAEKTTERLVEALEREYASEEDDMDVVTAGMQVETTRGSAAAAFEAKGSAHLDKLSDWSNSDLSEAERAGKARKVALLTGGAKPSPDSDVSDDFEAAVASTAARRRRKAEAAARGAALAAGVNYVEPSAQAAAAAAPAHAEAPAAATAGGAPAAADADVSASTVAAASELAHPAPMRTAETRGSATVAAASELAPSRPRALQRDAAPVTAADAVPAAWLQQATVAAAAGSDGGASATALVEESIALTSGGDGSSPASSTPAFLRPAAPQRPALPAALAHAAVDDAGNVLLERVADAPLGDGLTESPFPGLVRRRRSGVPLAPTEYMARPANLAPSIATELESAGGGAEASEEAAGELFAGPGSAGAGVGGTAGASQAAAAAAGASASPAPSRQRSALEIAADDADAVLAAVRAERNAAAASGSALSALHTGAAPPLAPLSPEQRIAQQRERERQEIIAAARLEVAQLLMPAPTVPSAELYPHLASKHLRKRSRAYDPGDAAADAAGEAGSPQQLRRRIVARAVARMLRQEMLPRLERSLVLASEDVRKYRKRRALGLAPSAMDAMMAVQVLKDRAQETAQSKADAADAGAAAERAAQPAAGAGPSASAPAPGSALATLPAPGESALAAAELGLSRGQRTHAARQDAALQVAGALTASGSRGELRMRALVDMSERVLAGAHWLPMGGRSTAGAYPTDRAALKAVLLTELENVYHGELPRMGVSPDIVTLNTMLNAYCVAGANEQAYNFLKAEFPRWGFSPDARTFRSLVSMHVHQRRTEKAEKVLQLMKAHGVAPDQDTYGLLVHARARDYRIKDAIALLQEMQAAGHVCGEYYAFLLRQRCKELGIFHAAVPAHPVGWQFTPEVMAKRRSGKEMAHKLSKFMRPKIGKFR